TDGGKMLRCESKEAPMRTTTLFVTCALALLCGCQTPQVRRTPALPAAPKQSSLSDSAQETMQKPVIQPVQHIEAVQPPVPEPVQLPPAKLKPVQVGALTLADLEQMALSANPSVARAAALVEAARGNWVQVGLPPNPSAGYEGQQIGSGGRAEQDGVFVEQEFVRGGKLTLNRNVAAQEVARAEHQLAAQQQRVLTDVRIAFYQVLIAQRQQALTLELRNIAAEGVKTAEALQRGKEVGKVDVVQAQLELENVEILVENARNRSRAAWQTLASVVGNPQLRPQPL